MPVPCIRVKTVCQTTSLSMATVVIVVASTCNRLRSHDDYLISLKKTNKKIVLAVVMVAKSQIIDQIIPQVPH